MKVSMTISHSSDLNKWNGKCVKIPCIVFVIEKNATKNNQRKKITLKAVYTAERGAFLSDLNNTIIPRSSIFISVFLFLITHKDYLSRSALL